MAKVQKLPVNDHHDSVEQVEVPRARNGRPYMECMHVKDLVKADGQPGKSLWTRVGFAFQNRDGTWNLELSALPTDGRIHMRPPRPRFEGEQASA